MEEKRNQEQNEEMSMEDLKKTAGGKRILDVGQTKDLQAKEKQYGIPEEEDGQDVYVHY